MRHNVDVRAACMRYTHARNTAAGASGHICRGRPGHICSSKAWTHLPSGSGTNRSAEHRAWRWAASSQGLRAGPRRWPGRVPMAMWASFARHGRPGLAGNGARLIWESGVSRLRKLGRKWLLKVYGSRRHPASPDFGARQRGRADQAPAGHWRDTHGPASKAPGPANCDPWPQPRPAAPERPAPAETAPTGLRRGRGGQQGAGPGAGPGWGWAGRSSEACVDWARLPVAVPACAGGRGHRVRKVEFLKECACVYGHRRRTKSTRVVDMIVCSIGARGPSDSIFFYRTLSIRF
jgi:hypothetical protein